MCNTVFPAYEVKRPVKNNLQRNTYKGSVKFGSFFGYICIFLCQIVSYFRYKGYICILPGKAGHTVTWVPKKNSQNMSHNGPHKICVQNH